MDHGCTLSKLPEDLMELNLEEARLVLKKDDSSKEYVDLAGMEWKLNGDDQHVDIHRADGSSFMLPVTDELINHFIPLAGTPQRKYLGSLKASMFATIMNYHSSMLQDTGRFNNLTMVLNQEDRKVLGFTSREFSRFNASDVLDAVASELGEQSVVRRLDSNPMYSAFTVTDESLNNAFLDQSDIQYFGITCAFDRLGRSAPEIRATAHRKVCSNVMMSTSNMTPPRFMMMESGRDILLEKFRSAARKGIEYIDQVMVPRIKATVERQVDPNATINRIIRANRIPEEIQEALHAAYTVEPGSSLYHVTNAFTRAANNPAVGGWAGRLRAIAAGVTENEVPDQCPTCSTKL